MKNEAKELQTKNQPEQLDETNTKTDEIIAAGARVYAQTEQAVSQAYDKTAKVVGETYEQAKTFGRENPERTALIAFGVGVGVGLLVGTRRSRSGRIVQPLIDAAYDVASALVR